MRVRLGSCALATGMFLVAWTVARSPAVAQAAPPATPAEALAAQGHTVPLTESDLQSIMLEVLKQRPLLSASPGIKFAEAYRGYRVTQGSSADLEVTSGQAARDPAVSPVIQAFVIFFPHFDSGGVKQAYQVNCERRHMGGSWDCPWIRIRRYLRVEGQDFETRVIHDIGSDVARALIEATRETARAGAKAKQSVPDTAVIVFPVERKKYVVSWGSSDGQATVDVEAALRNGGDPRNPSDWETRVLEPEAAH